MHRAGLRNNASRGEGLTAHGVKGASRAAQRERVARGMNPPGARGGGCILAAGVALEFGIDEASFHLHFPPVLPGRHSF